MQHLHTGVASRVRCLICRQRDFDSHSSGTTGVVVLMRGSRIWTAHAGDSRCALGRRFSDGTIEAKNLTLDHKVRCCSYAPSADVKHSETIEDEMHGLKLQLHVSATPRRRDESDATDCEQLSTCTSCTYG